MVTCVTPERHLCALVRQGASALAPGTPFIVLTQGNSSKKKI